MSDIEITVFRKTVGTLSKRIWLRSDGTVGADGSECRMTAGTAYRTKLNGVHSLADLILDLRHNEALALGRLRVDLRNKVNVVVKRKLNGSASPDVIARTADFLHFAAGKPAYLLLDHDRKGTPANVASKLKELGFWRAVTEVIPALAGAACVTRRSTSAGLYNRRTDKWLPGSSGLHIYIAVKDGGDIERALMTLHDRLWLAGFGFFVVGAKGQLLDRSIIDASVYGAERLVFEGEPILEPPVGQDQEERRPKVYDGEVIDTATAIAPLMAAEKERLAALKAEAKRQLQPQAVAARRAWAAEFAARHGLSVEQAVKIARAASEQHTLPTEFELEFDELGTCTVKEVLADPDRYVGETLADPLEGVAYGSGKAKVLRQHDGLLMIHSFAHGGIKYQLAGQGVRLEDFCAYMPKHNYVYMPGRAPWPAGSVNSRIPPVKLVDANGQPVPDAKGKQKSIPASQWLDQNRPVEQMTWLPGAPTIIRDKLIDQGGWIRRPGVSIFNLYRPPTLRLGDRRGAGRWLDHVRKIYPDDAEHILDFLAHRVQRPAEKINHGLILGGAQGVGKDTLLEPVKMAVGPWNFEDVTPKQILGRFNNFVQSVILRISEARDLGDYDRYDLHEHFKTLLAAPPDVLRVDEKNLPEHPVFNICAVIITTNHIDGIYLTADDRRHYVAWTELGKDDFGTDEDERKEYWDELWGWYYRGGFENVAAYLSDRDLSRFNPKAPPPKTEAWWRAVNAGRNPEDADFADALDRLGNPEAVTLNMIKSRAYDTFDDWLGDPRNRRAIPHRLQDCGYVQVMNSEAKDGMWKVAGSRVMIYARAEMSQRERVRAARALQGEYDRRRRH